MEELTAIVEGLINYWVKKENSLKEVGEPTTNQYSLLANRWKDIEAFKAHAEEAKVNVVHKLQIIDNFTKGANEIKSLIDSI